MTGSKARGGTSRGSGKSQFGVGSDCENIQFETIINSPVPDIQSLLKKGDCLEVALSVAADRRIVVASRNGQRVGSITSAAVSKLIECLVLGMQFKAIVLEVSKGLCRVAISVGPCR